MNANDFEMQRKIQWDILTRYDKYITDTNTKTSIILTIQILIAGATATNFIALSNYLVDTLNLNKVVAAFIPLYLIASGAAIAWNCISIVIPNLTSTGIKSNFFFVDVANTPSKSRQETFSNLNDDLLGDLFEQVMHVSAAVTKKMKHLQFIYRLIKYAQLAPVLLFLFALGVMA